MTSFGSLEIDRYVTDHTTEVPPYLADLPRVTGERMGSAGMISGPVVDGLLQTLIVASGAPCRFVLSNLRNDAIV